MNKNQLIRKLEKIQDLLNEIVDTDIDEVIFDCEEKRDAIEEKASDRDSGEMTDREQERFDELEDLINNLEDLKEEFQEKIDDLDLGTIISNLEW